MYRYLLRFDRLYDKFTYKEKKAFLLSIAERIESYEDEQPDGRFLKSDPFRFPVFCDGQEIRELSWDNENPVETASCLYRQQKDFISFCHDYDPCQDHRPLHWLNLG